MTIIENIAASLKILNKDWTSVTEFLKSGISLDSITDNITDFFEDNFPKLTDIVGEFNTNIVVPILDGIEKLSEFDFSAAIVQPITDWITDNVEDVIVAPIGDWISENVEGLLTKSITQILMEWIEELLDDGLMDVLIDKIFKKIIDSTFGNSAIGDKLSDGIADILKGVWNKK